jgi:hypothetical protein
MPLEHFRDTNKTKSAEAARFHGGHLPETETIVTRFSHNLKFPVVIC